MVVTRWERHRCCAFRTFSLSDYHTLVVEGNRTIGGSGVAYEPAGWHEMIFDNSCAWAITLGDRTRLGRDLRAPDCTPHVDARKISER